MSTSYNNNSNNNNNNDRPRRFFDGYTVDGNPRKPIWDCTDDEIVRDYTVSEIEYAIDSWAVTYPEQLYPVLERAREERDRRYARN